MKKDIESFEALRDIRQMMAKSSRFISLSGLSGVSAGICALAGAWVAHPYIYGYRNLFFNNELAIQQMQENSNLIIFNSPLFWIAAATFFLALTSSFLFTYAKSKKQNIPIWGSAAKRLLLNVCIPLVVGGIFLMRMLQYGTFGLVASGCLLFYGLALVNASKFTLNEIRYLGYCEILLGLVATFFVGYGLYFWAFGFGILHILYGVYMWWKYEKQD